MTFGSWLIISIIWWICTLGMSIFIEINIFLTTCFLSHNVAIPRSVETLSQLLDILTYFHHSCPAPHYICSLYTDQFQLTGHSLDSSDIVLYEWLFPHNWPSLWWLSMGLMYIYWYFCVTYMFYIAEKPGAGFNPGGQIPPPPKDCSCPSPPPSPLPPQGHVSRLNPGGLGQFMSGV